MRSVAALLAGLAMAAATATARAGDLWLGGASESGLSGYSYVGVLIPLGSDSLGQGWVGRQWVDRVTYRYNGFAADIHAAQYGYSPALGYQWALGSGRTHAALYAGLHVAYTHLDPYDPSNPDRGTHVRPTLQGELTNSLGRRVENRFLAQGELGNGAYFVRDRLSWQVLRHYTLGPEWIAQGSREYHAISAGVCFGGIALARHVTLLLHADVYRQAGLATVGTGGVELAASF